MSDTDAIAIANELVSLHDEVCRHTAIEDYKKTRQIAEVQLGSTDFVEADRVRYAQKMAHSFCRPWCAQTLAAKLTHHGLGAVTPDTPAGVPEWGLPSSKD
jgi:hypothetical protein